MGFALGSHTYGKAEIRLVKVARGEDRDDLADLTVGVTLTGDFAGAYREGDNRTILPTDTLMRTVYALAADDPLRSIEEFGQRLVAHFLEAAPAATGVEAGLLLHPWNRIDGHGHAFVRGGGGERTATVTGSRDEVAVRAGIEDLLVLKTRGSAFRGFLADEYTLLEETDDRVLATVVTAEWSYPTTGIDYTARWGEVRETLLSAFADHDSQSVQHTIWVLGQAVMKRVPEVDRIRFSLPNRHHLTVDLTAYGRAGHGEVFAVPDRPYGLITGTVERS